MVRPNCLVICYHFLKIQFIVQSSGDYFLLWHSIRLIVKIWSIHSTEMYWWTSPQILK